MNANLKGYCRTVIDPKSLDFFLHNLSLIEDELNRSYIWRTLWDNLKINIVSVEQYLQCFIKHFFKETEEYTMMVSL